MMPIDNTIARLENEIATNNFHYSTSDLENAKRLLEIAYKIRANILARK